MHDRKRLKKEEEEKEDEEERGGKRRQAGRRRGRGTKAKEGRTGKEEEGEDKGRLWRKRRGMYMTGRKEDDQEEVQDQMKKRITEEEWGRRGTEMKAKNGKG